MLHEAKSLRWLEFAFPLQIPAQDENDRMCNAIHLYAKAGADKLDAQVKEIEVLRLDIETMRKFTFDFKVKAERMQRKEAALTAAIQKYVPLEELCHLCRHEGSCATEALDEDGQITRYWRCRAGEQFEIKEE